MDSVCLVFTLVLNVYHCKWLVRSTVQCWRQIRRVSKTSHLWLAITLTHVNGFWYFWQKCYRLSKQSKDTLLCHITCASALPCKTEKRENCIFPQMLYQCIAWVQTAAWFLQSFWLTTHTHDAVWLPKSCNQCMHSAIGTTGGMVQEKGSR